MNIAQVVVIPKNSSLVANGLVLKNVLYQFWLVGWSPGQLPQQRQFLEEHEHYPELSVCVCMCVNVHIYTQTDPWDTPATPQPTMLRRKMNQPYDGANEVRTEK